jgi:hypothetical protein
MGTDPATAETTNPRRRPGEGSHGRVYAILRFKPETVPVHKKFHNYGLNRWSDHFLALRRLLWYQHDLTR